MSSISCVNSSSVHHWLGVSTDHLLTGQETAPADIAGAIRAEPHLSAAAKRHLIGLANELRDAS